jgi:hypothetical protein
MSRILQRVDVRGGGWIGSCSASVEDGDEDGSDCAARRWRMGAKMGRIVQRSMCVVEDGGEDAGGWGEDAAIDVRGGGWRRGCVGLCNGSLLGFGVWVAL